MADRNKFQTIGIIETAGTTYTTYSDPDSENLIGQTDRLEKFFINLKDDYSKTQFLRISNRIKTRKDFDVAIVKHELAHRRKEER